LKKKERRGGNFKTFRDSEAAIERGGGGLKQKTN